VTAVVVAAVAVIALAIGALRRDGVTFFLWWHDAFEVKAERAPAAHATLTDLTLTLDLPHVRLFVTSAMAPAAFAVRRRDLIAVGLEGPLLERLTPQEVRGTLALLVALLANPGNWRRERDAADWAAIEELAAKLTSADAVAAALAALASAQRDPTTRERLMAELWPDVRTLVRKAPPRR
jgi:hypothetical protein